MHVDNQHHAGKMLALMMVMIMMVVIAAHQPIPVCKAISVTDAPTELTLLRLNR
jgi:hypothetical protein